MTSNFTAPAPLKTAVLFLVFNRPDTTAQVFKAIRQTRPPRLYVAGDGARDGLEGEAEYVAEVRNIATAVDWPCEVKTLFREKNLGCKSAVSSAINWFFEYEEQGIILEDDCLPSQSFFWYCEELLNSYEKEERVCSISGSLRKLNKIDGDNEIYKSRFFNMWGWATWRRQWEMYDVNYFVNNEFDEGVYNIFYDKKVKCYWRRIFNGMKNHKTDTWDYQMFFLAFSRLQYTIYPKYNMVKNIGFGNKATHTINYDPEFSNVEITNMYINEISKSLDDLVNIDNKFYREYSCKAYIISLIGKLKFKIKMVIYNISDKLNRRSN